MKTGIELIEEERERQVSVEGWTAEHDAQHQYGELASAAACYANPVLSADPRISTPEGWPWEEEWWKPSLNYRNDYVRKSHLPKHRRLRITDLVKAGALISAEIDRLQRNES